MKVFRGVQAFYGKYDFSSIGNTFEPGLDVGIVESKPFNATAVGKDFALYDFSGTLTSYLPFTAATNDVGADLINNRGSKQPLSFHMDKLAAVKGDPSLFVNAVHGGVTMPFSQGELRTVQIALGGDGPGIWGKVLEIGTKTATGDGGTGVGLTAAADGETVYCVLHCTASTGTFDVTVESDSTDAFASPTTRFTFTQIVTTVPASEFLLLKQSGGITDTFWRANWVSASTPSHAISMSIGKV